MADYRDDFVKYVHIHYDADNKIWYGLIYAKRAYEAWQDSIIKDEDLPDPIDVLAAIDEVTLLSRIKLLYPAISIGYTDGKTEFLPY